MRLEMPAQLLAVLAVSSACSALLVNFVMRHSRRLGVLVPPGARQSHSEPTPTGAGAGMVLAAVIVTVLLGHFVQVNRGWTLLVLPSLVLLSAIGYLDDRYPVSAWWRLLVQAAVSLALLGWLHAQWMELPWWGWALGAVASVWVMNAYNFMDGSHGMAGSQGVFAGLALGLIFLDNGAPGLAFPALLVAGVCAGFLPMNFPVARIFMGDSGSVPLGFALVSLIGLGYAQEALGPMEGLMVLSVFLVDSTLTLLKRVFRGERWYTAHKQHIYQRLIDQGWSHSRVLLLYQAINLVLVAPALVLAGVYPDLAWTLAGTLFLLLITGWYTASLRLGVRR